MDAVEVSITLLVEQNNSEDSLEYDLDDAQCDVNWVSELIDQTPLGNIPNFTNKRDISLALGLCQGPGDCRVEIHRYFTVLFHKIVDELVELCFALLLTDGDALLHILHLDAFLVHRLHVEVGRVGI